MPLRSEFSGAACTLDPPDMMKSGNPLRTKVEALAGAAAEEKARKAIDRHHLWFFYGR